MTTSRGWARDSVFNMKIILVRYIISTLTTGSGGVNMRVKCEVVNI